MLTKIKRLTVCIEECLYCAVDKTNYNSRNYNQDKLYVYFNLVISASSDKKANIGGTFQNMAVFDHKQEALRLLQFIIER